MDGWNISIVIRLVSVCLQPHIYAYYSNVEKKGAAGKGKGKGKGTGHTAKATGKATGKVTAKAQVSKSKGKGKGTTDKQKHNKKRKASSTKVGARLCAAVRA